MSVLFYVNIIQIVIAAALIALVLLQTKNTSLGSVFGGDSSIHKTRRGVDKTLHQATIALSFVFFFIAVMSVVLTA